MRKWNWRSCKSFNGTFLKDVTKFLIGFPIHSSPLFPQTPFDFIMNLWITNLSISLPSLFSRLLRTLPSSQNLQILLQILVVAVRDSSISCARDAMMIFLLQRQRMTVVVCGRRRRRVRWRLIIVLVTVWFFFLLFVSQLAERNFSLHVERSLRGRFFARRFVVCAVAWCVCFLLFIVWTGAGVRCGH